MTFQSLITHPDVVAFIQRVMPAFRFTWAGVGMDPEEIRHRFEEKMTSERDVITGRIKRHLVPTFDEICAHYAKDHPPELSASFAANHASEILIAAREGVMQEYASGLDGNLTAEARAQKMMQASKSNAGKIFERFSAYAVSRALAGTRWVVWKDTADLKQWIGIDKKNLFRIDREAFGDVVSASLEADYVIFNVDRPLSSLILASCKSSMKDRLHSVTMWAILFKGLRHPAFLKEFSISGPHLDTLARSRYILITGDIAVEQPDLRGGAARGLLQFDSSFYDGAFAAVTEGWNPTLPNEADADTTGKTPFYRLSAIRSYVETLEDRPDVPVEL